MLEFSEENLEKMREYIKEMEEQGKAKHKSLKKDLTEHSFILSSIQKLIDSDVKAVYFDSHTIFKTEEFDRLFSALELTTDLTGTCYELTNRHFPVKFSAVLFGDYVVKLETIYGQGTMSSIEVELISESDIPDEILENSHTLEFLLKHGCYLLDNASEIREKREILEELDENLNSTKEILESEYISSNTKLHLLTAVESLETSIATLEEELKIN